MAYALRIRFWPMTWRRCEQLSGWEHTAHLHDGLTARPMRPKSPTASVMVDVGVERGADGRGGVSLRRPGAQAVKQLGRGWESEDGECRRWGGSR